MDDKKIREDLSKRKNELLETVAALNSMLPRYMDDILIKKNQR